MQKSGSVVEVGKRLDNFSEYLARPFILRIPHRLYKISSWVHFLDEHCNSFCNITVIFCQTHLHPYAQGVTTANSIYNQEVE